jgi:hypothetical protein
VTLPRLLAVLTVAFAAAAGALHDHAVVSVVLLVFAAVAFAAEELVHRRRA